MTPEDFRKPALSYPTELGSIAFGTKEIGSQKDALYNLSIETARNEFNKLKALAEIINAQAREVQLQLETSALINQAEYNFKPKPNEIYWLVKDKENQKIFLCMLGPKDWSTSPPENFAYIDKVKYLVNGLWQKIEG